MVLRIYWLAVGIFALTMTLAYLFRPEERVTFTSLMAGVAWAWMSLLAGDLEIYVQGSLEQATVPSLQYITAGLSLLSLLVTILYRFDEYPPRPDDYQEIQGDA